MVTIPAVVAIPASANTLINELEVYEFEMSDTGQSQLFSARRLSRRLCGCLVRKTVPSAW